MRPAERAGELPAYRLALADGRRLTLCAGDESAAQVLEFLARTAGLPPAPAAPPQTDRRLLVVSAESGAPRLEIDEAGAVCTLTARDAPRRRRRRLEPAGAVDSEPISPEQWFWRQLSRLSGAIGRETQPGGGVLLHSGLAAYPGASAPGVPAGPAGVLLAGRSGVGKSTASHRLPPPWRALADDLALVVRDAAGAYHAHPWPTWSRFFGKDPGDGRRSWQVEGAVPLRAIVVLEQGERDRIEPLGPGHTVALLARLAGQTSTHLVDGMPLDERAAFHRQRFDNLCALARAVPAYLLTVSLAGPFWRCIESVLHSR